MRLIAFVICLLVAPVVAYADCTPTYVWGHTNISTNVENRIPYDAIQQIIDTTNDSHIFTIAVPEGYIWKMRTISLSIYGGHSAEYMIEHLVKLPPFVGYHYHAIARTSIEAVAGTPVLAIGPADAGAVIMQSTERLGARANGGISDMMLLWSAWQFPESCLAKVLGVD